MKGISKRLKKIIIICFIFSVLSNHISILGNICNIAYASELEMRQPTAILDNNSQNETEREENLEESSGNETAEEVTSNNESSEEDLEVENQVPIENTAETEEVTEETNTLESNQLNSLEENEIIKNNLILEENDKTLEEDKSSENQLSVENKIESYQIEEIEVSSNLNLDKFIRYDNESGKGVFLETTLKVEFNKDKKEINTMLISLDVPKVNELMPVYINIANATSWEYNQEEGKININVENIEQLANEISLEYKLLLVYEKEAYSASNITVNGIAKMQNTEQSVEKEIVCSIPELKETTESFVQYTAQSENASIYKGYLKANTVSDIKYETSYDVTKKVEIKDSEFIDTILLEDSQEKLVQENGNEIDFSSKYKKTLVNVAEYEDIFAGEGYIEIYNQDKVLLGKIDRNSTVENDSYVFEYVENVEKVIFKLVNPVKDGEISIKNKKAILDTNVFTNDQVDSFKYIKSSITGKLVKEINDLEIILQNVIFENQITLENTESKMEIELDNSDFSTEIENNVAISVTLKTDEEKYELFKNPSIDIEFPYSVEEVEIENVNLLYKNGLSLDSWNVVTNTTGEKIIRVKLAGAQSAYTPGTLLEGTEVVIYANVKVNRLTANSSSNIKLRYSNEASSRISYALAGKEAEEHEINYVSKSGLIKATNFESFNDNFDVITNYNNELNLGSLDLNKDARTSKMSMAILNNHNTEISNVVVVGRIPAVGNKDKDENDLNTTIDTYLNRELSVSGLVSKVYYSNDINAKKDDDSWQETVEDITKVKSYKIVIENEVMKKGESILFDYDLVIPEDLEFNQEMYGIFSVYYNLNGETIIEDSIVGAKTEVKALELQDCQTTETIPEVALGVGTQVTLAGKVIDETTEVHSGQILRYNVVLTNNGTAPITNIKLKGTVENGNMYWFSTYTTTSSSTFEEVETGEWIEDQDGSHAVEEFTIESLEPGQSKEVSYQVVAKEAGKEIFGNIEVSADNITASNIETIKNKVKDAKLKLSVTSGILEDLNNMYLTTNNQFKVVVKVKNTSSEALENVNLQIKMPECMEVNESLTELFYDVEIQKYKSTTGYLIETNIEKLEANEEKEVWLHININDIDLLKEKENIRIVVSSEIGEEKYYSNDYVREVYQTSTAFSAKYTANRENGTKIKDGDEIIYKLEIKNEGVVTGSIGVTDYLPYGLKISRITLINSDGTTEDIKYENYFMNEQIRIQPKDTKIIEIVGNVDISDCRTDQSNISNIFELSGELIDSEIEEISYVIEYPEGYFDEEDSVMVEDEFIPIDEEIEEDNIPEEPKEDDTQDNIPEEPKEDDTQDNTPEEPKEDDTQDNTPEEPKEDDVQDNTPEEPKEDGVQDNTPEEPKDDDVQDNTPEEPKDDALNNNSNNNTTNENNNSNYNTSNDVKKEYSISGFVWIDKDKNGLYNSEEKFENIEVYLYKANNLNINNTNLVSSTKTDKEGNYSFTKLEEAEYIIVFSYDNLLYTTTKYLTNGGASTNKSYVTEKELEINGTTKKYGLSDVITLSGNKSNINAGLVELNEFDMEIKTYLSSATIVNSKESTTKEFEENSNLNKIEIASKYLAETKITFKYKVTIKNNGNISGYVNQIEYILPEGFEFDEALNSNWTLGNDGKIYNSSMSDTEIKAGESKSYTLILTKQMTENSTGTFKTEAKITNSTNNLQVEDCDNENDTSMAEVIITVKTGAIVYISIIFVVMAIILLITMYIDYKLLKNKIFKSNKFIKIFIIVLLLGTFSFKSISLAVEYWETLISESIETYFNENIPIGTWIGYSDAEGYFYHSYKVQCIHPDDISLPNTKGENKRKVFADIKIGYDDSNVIKTTYTKYNASGNITANDNNFYSQMVGFLANYFENAGNGSDEAARSILPKILYKYSTENETYWWNNWTGTQLKASSEQGEQNQGTIDSNLETQFNSVTKFYTSNSGRLNVSKGTSSPTYRDGYLGPFKAKFPTGEYNVSNKNKVYVGDTEYTENVYEKTSTGYSKANIENLNDKEFYIKYTPSNNEASVTVKFENSYKYYKGRILCTGFEESGQSEAIIRGKELTHTDDKTTWTVDLGCDVSVEKSTLYYNGSSFVVAENDAQRTFERGDTVYFKIVVNNNSGRTINLRITDEFYPIQLEYIDGQSYGWIKSNDNDSYYKDVDVGTGGYTTYIALRVKEDLILNSDNKYHNWAKISNFKNKSTDTKTLNNKTGNIVNDSDYVKCATYKASINKYIVGITGQTISSRNSNKDTTLYAEPGDEVKFAIKITNTGRLNDNNGNIKNISFTDTWTNSGYITDIKYSSSINGTYLSSLPTSWSKNGNTYTYSGTIETKNNDSSAYLYIKCKVSKSDTSIARLVRNSVNITEINNKNNIDIYKTSNNTNIMESITAVSNDSFKIKMYNISIEKSINVGHMPTPSVINNEVYFETGDIVQYIITVKNEGEGNEYGKIRNLTIEEEFKSDQLEYVSATGLNWTKSGNNFTYNKYLDLGESATLIIDFKVIKKSRSNYNIRNTVSFTNVKNKNNYDLYEDATNYLHEDSILSDEEKFKLKIYKMEVSKKVNAIYNASGNLIEGETSNAEIGDIIEYEIKVTNVGHNNTYGVINEISLSDYFDNRYLEYVSISEEDPYGSWSVESQSDEGNVTTINLKYDPVVYLLTDNNYQEDYKNNTIVYLKLRVNVSNANDLLEDSITTNTVEIKTTDKVLNKNEIDIREVLHGTLKSQASVKILSYRLKLSKYIANGSLGQERYGMTNEEKYNSPYEAEKNNQVLYKIKVENVGQSILEDLIIQDIAEEGLEFVYVSSYKITKGGIRGTIPYTITTENNNKNIRLNNVNFKKLNPGESFELEILYRVTKTNLHLLNLTNRAEVVQAYTRNNVDVAKATLISYTNKENEDYVRLKDLVISGHVWEDKNKDGYMEDSENKISGITVKLYDVTNNKVATTVTNSDGYYIFGETNGVNIETGKEETVPMISSDGRVVKATNKDPETGNYDDTSEYIKYYLEYEYNGITFESTIYKSDQNINSDGTYKEEYLVDSNAVEYNAQRTAFNKKFETMSYNQATGKDSSGNDIGTALSYSKDGHESKLDTTSNTIITARSFANRTVEGEVKHLWLFEDGETEYLKHINLGLQKRLGVDVSVAKDVYEVKTTINGEETIYEYNQGNTLDLYKGDYTTGGENARNYKFELYNSDYFYEHTQYSSQEVIKYKENTELNVEVTYKVTITNSNREENDGSYVIVNELVDFYSENFIEYENNSNNIKKIKVKDSEGFLYEKDLPVVEQVFVNGNADPTLNLSLTPKYKNDNNISGYNKLFVSGLENKKLKQGESVDIYLKYVLDVYTNENVTEDLAENINHLILGSANNIVEINAYSVYTQYDRPAGYVDDDSNPGNLTDDTPYEEYEDDTYKTGIDMYKMSLDNNYLEEVDRSLSGFVWDDARSSLVEDQYVGNGIYDKNDENHPNAAKNSKVSHNNDAPISGVRAELIELISIKQPDGSVRTYEESIKTVEEAVMDTETYEGNYRLYGFIPGRYITRFTYGHSSMRDMMIYNGQDYKSTTFYEETQNYTEEEVLEVLEEVEFSDARDDEIERLEVNSNYEVINNKKSQINRIRSGDYLALHDLIRANMDAETVAYRVPGERGLVNGNRVPFVNYFPNIMSGTTIHSYEINNIDFGIEYRPETNVELNKFISNINVTSSDGSTLFNIAYKNVYEDNDETKAIIGTEIDRDNSVGVDHFQFLPTQQNPTVKGMAYLNTDTSLLQGSTVKITYIFCVRNNSEVDRISKNLYDIKYKADAQKLEEYKDYIDDETYTASGLAANKLYSEYYGVDADGVEYRTKEKADVEYFGKYTGTMYHKGYVGDNDVISEIKVDKILDYVDTDLVFNTSENASDNNFWQATTSKELYDGGFVDKSIFKEVDGSHFLVDSKEIRYDTDNISNLAVSVDDKTSDEDTNNKNKSLSRFIKPHSNSAAESFGIISLVTSKVVASEADTNDMSYDNTAEIIQYTTLNGRITGLNSTIGNLDMNKEENQEEADTGYTETISLIPPTGAYTLKYYMSRHVNKIIVIATLIVVVSIGIILKKKIGKINLKKVYK